MKKRKLLAFFIFPAIIFSFALFFRLYNLDSTEIYPDEITWTVRSREAFLAIKTKNLDYFKTAWWNKTGDTEAINLPTAITSGASIFFLAKGQPTHYSLSILPDYLATRIPLVFMGSVFAVIFYFVSRKITQNDHLSLLAGLLLALDPTSIALSRWSLADYPLTIWLFLALSSFFLIKRKNLSIAISAFFISLAFLTKPTALIVFLPLVIFSPIKSFFTILMFLIFTKILWFGQTQNIVVEIYSYFIRQVQLSNKVFITFFQGKITGNPPFYYYLQQIITRIPTVPIIFSIFSFPTIKKIKTKPKYLLRIIIPLFITSYLLLMSIPAKKLGIRYVSPIIPWIYLYASISIFTLFDRLKPIFRISIYSLIIVFSIGIAVYYFPNYYLYYNLLAGGPKEAQNTELVGLCMGAKKSTEFITQNYPSAGSVAYLGCSKTTIPYYSGIAVSTNWQNEELVIIEESLKTLSPSLEEIEFYKDKKPVFINKWRGVVLSRIYDNTQ